MRCLRLSARADIRQPLELYCVLKRPFHSDGRATLGGAEVWGLCVIIIIFCLSKQHYAASMKEDDDFTNVVVCGDRTAEPTELCLALRATQHGLAVQSNASIRFEAWTELPTTLVTNVDIVLLCFSPCHPVTFLHAIETWAPLFAHLPYVRVIIVATKFELTMSPSIRDALRTAGVSPVERVDVSAAASELSQHFNDATITYIATTLSTPIEEWVGAVGKHNGAPPAVFSRSVKDVLRACVEDEGYLTEENAMEQWRRTSEDVERDMHERALLSEWMQVSYGYFAEQGSSHSTAELTPVYVSRKSHRVEMTMPAELVRKRLDELHADYHSRCKMLLDNTPETYLLRKASADADRRRAVDRSARRSAVLDPILQKHERRSDLQREVQQLEQARDKIHTAKKENADKRKWLDEVHDQLRASTAVLEGETTEITSHARQMSLLTEQLEALVREEENAKAAEEAVVSKTLQSEVEESTESYRTLWEANKQRRLRRASIESDTCSVQARIDALREDQAALTREEDELSRRIEGHLLDMNTAQDTLLVLEAQRMVLSEQLHGCTTVERTSGVDSLLDVYISADLKIVPAVERLEETRRRLYTAVINDLVSLCDLEIAPMELLALRMAIEIEKLQCCSSSSSVHICDALQLEMCIRLWHRCAELQERCALAVACSNHCGELASAGLQRLAQKLLRCTTSN